MWETRALELNNQELWNWHQACQFVDYACAHNFNTVVIGQTDLLGKLVTPAGYTPAQYNDRISVHQRCCCVYLNRLAQYCKARGLRFYLQAKELGFPADLLLHQPQLFDGHGGLRFDVDFWSQYLADKLALVCQQIPAIDGLLLAISNTDSLVPIATPDWKKNVAQQKKSASSALYRCCFNAAAQVMARHHKHLVLRLFPASIDGVEPVLEAITGLPADVAVSIKLTPERFWPEFPNNPALLAITDREVWAEVDAAGEEVCWGNLPFIRVDEIQGRLLWCRASNPAIKGVLCKASWEGIDNHCVIGTLSEFNLFSCAKFLDPQAPSENTAQLLKRWLLECWQWPADEQQLLVLMGLFEQAHQVIYSAIYARHHVFHRHSLLPESYGQVVWSLYGQLNRNHWLPGSADDIVFASQDAAGASRKLSLIAAEKDLAWQGAENVQRQALEFAKHAGFPPALAQRWQTEWQGLFLYCRAFIHAQKAFFTLHYAREVENNWSLREVCQANIQALYGTAHEMEDFCGKWSDIPPAIHVMFDAGRARALAGSLSKELAKLSG
ncbi:hypothetical protein M976_02104 [Buttiauxella ferragutiae ATCC 51602]|uniref:Uncharacterized protein n=1 Tax=Buttiauxella ferragutiae ATCC 51602 TaxID=1354252 RepID=A0ABX2W8M0_9ENTR|nr:hypothetical protein [Buttiauxella]MCE0825525.1 hypothetical protein [Buttiauxella ferragutiae]OAT27968.1 hypothetical protein M976_02104 [Buttiauxella ferragutiae ATCC 51602]TDN55499.1 hypothetical protein EC843_1011583 [Buttiauxella sp. JUb87]